jgi:phenylacetate-CoA ligase
MGRIGRMNEVLRGLRTAKQTAGRETWSRDRMQEHQAARVDELVRHVVANSPFYRDRFAGLVGSGRVELEKLPPLDKTTLMANLDGALCDPRLRGLDLRSHLHDRDLLLGEHRVMASSGSTGTPSLYVYSRSDWTGIMAMFFRYSETIGVRPRMPRLRIAPIGAPTLASMTQKVALTTNVGLHRLKPMSVTDPLPQMVATLNEFQPQMVNAYPSVAALLADEQLAGRLRISPEIMSTSSELRTPEMTERIERAFGLRPFDTYATTEGLWGVECEHHSGPHLFEDFCVVENTGDRLLVTNLCNRTLPLIRFEVSDVAEIDREPCACGRTLPRLRAIQGRLDDVLHLPGSHGAPVALHPTQFSLVAAQPGVREFQVVKRGDRLVLRLALGDDAAPATADEVARVLRDHLGGLGVQQPEVATETVPALERSAGGKLKLVVSE